MNRNFAALCLFCAIYLVAPSLASANIIGPVTIPTVPVGSAGNAPDPATGFGAVPYNYNIGTYDVTHSQYAEFLNAKVRTADPYALWNSDMDAQNSTGWQGINRSQSAPYSYTVAPGYANKPVIALSWYSAVRFVNWLQNGQGNGDTESGTYTITGGGVNSGTVTVPSEATRNAWAASHSFHWLLPSENEWYKAAYYNGTAGTFYAYPFQSNSQPTAVVPPGGGDTGNFNKGAYNSDGFHSYLTDVGSYTNSVSPFGSYDMGGNVQQWNDTAIFIDPVIGTVRGCRGSDWIATPGDSAASFRDGFDPHGGATVKGFRVASVGSVPEPSTGLLAAVACGLMWWK